jgi:chromosomal replication initiator protein
MTAAFDENWGDALRLIQGRLGNDRDFESWVAPIKICARSGTSIELGVADELFGQWFESEGYASLLLECLREVTGTDFSFSFKYIGKNGRTPEYAPQDSAIAPHDAPGGEGSLAPEQQLELGISMSGERLGSANFSGGAGSSESRLIEDHRFENFVKGSCNELAYAACKAVAENPGKIYNPLFIYGGAGLGKTHLLHAIGNELRASSPNMRVLYVTSEMYFNELVDSIRTNRMLNFRKRYREECDALLIDDVQFFARKGHTQDEFFHTFNALHASRKPIVFTSDRFPEEIEKLEERIRSRFQWGLTTDIKPPPLETRIAILTQKAEQRGMLLPDDVAMFIANRIRTNVRRLEGALTSLAAYASLKGEGVTIEMAKKALEELLPDEDRAVTVDQVCKLVSAYFSVKVFDIKGEKRYRAISRPRQVAMYLTRRFTKLSYPDIGAYFGNRDHSTVMSAVKKIESLLDKEDTELKRSIEVLSRQLEQ